MSPLVVALFLGGVAAVLAAYSFLERNSWMYSQISAAGLSAALLWILAAVSATGNIGESVILVANQTISNNTTVLQYATHTMPLLDPTLPMVIALFALVMSIYLVLHVANWLQDRILNRDEDEDDEN